MVGNDLVDIKTARSSSDWERPRFLETIFTSKEQRLILNSENSFSMVWRLWSMKEAAYKLYTQLYPSRFYTPKKFVCTIKGQKGLVTFQGLKCYVVTKITSNYIISEARLEEHKMNSTVLNLKHKNPKEQSKILKSELLKLVTELNNIKDEFIKIQKNEFGIPTVNYGLEKINISITHHGNYGAYVI